MIKNFSLLKKEQIGNRQRITLFGFIKINYRKKRPNLKKICISGNCVSGPLYDMLLNHTTLGQKYEIKLLKPVFMVEQQDVESIKRDVASCDIFITQPIKGENYKQLGIDTETLKSLMKKDSKLLKIPVPYFIGYFPEQFYLHDEKSTLIGECEGLAHPYHNRIIFYGYLKHLNAQEVLDILNSETNIKNITKIAEKSLEELKIRDENLDFGLYEFVKENYKNKRLFWTINHPTNCILEYMCNEILKKLSLDENFDINNLEEFLDKAYRTPIMKSVAAELQLSNIKDDEKYSVDIINAYYKYYEKHSELVEINKKEVENLL